MAVPMLVTLLAWKFFHTLIHTSQRVAPPLVKAPRSDRYLKGCFSEGRSFILCIWLRLQTTAS